jgi:tetratricopeptide (TPR) repeat protein
MPKKWFSYQIFIFFLLVFLCCTPVFSAEITGTPQVVPQPHEIVLKNKQEKPSWMLLWDDAREAAKNGDSQNAATLYRKLFSQKPQIEEALREYVLILIQLEQWQEARGPLQKLLEIDPEVLEYQFYGGQIALNQKRYQSASTYYGQVYTMSPGGTLALEALKGQIAALQKLERKELAYPLMEQLYLLVPHDEESLRVLAKYSMGLGNPEKAKSYYRTLLSEFDGIDLDFLESEPLFVAAGEKDMAVHCWTSYLEYHPFYLPFHRKLSEYYLEGAEKQKALPHLLVRVAHGEKNPEIFLQIGKLYLYQESRPDKALYYYDEYRKRNPGDQSITAEVKRIQAVLANDLLVIVENDGAWPLWRDLAKVIPDRLAVYYSIAEQLESLGKEDELLEVLEIINHHNPDDQKILFQLAQLYFKRGNLSACNESLDSLPEENRSGKEYFFLRAGVEEKRGNLFQALRYYKYYLQENPSDYSVVLDSMSLAGELNSLKEIDYFYALLPDKYEDISIYQRGSLLYGQLLVSNSLPTTARNFYQQLRTHGQLSTNDRLIVDKAIIKTLQAEKKYFTAEQQLRRLLIQESGNRHIAGQLIENALLEKDWQSAWKWYEFMALDPNIEGYDIFTWKILILEKSGQVAVASAMVDDFLMEEGSPCPQSEQQCLALKIKLIELYLAKEDFREAETLLDSISSEPKKNLEGQILTQLIQAGLSPVSGEILLQRSEEKKAIASINTALLYQKYGDHTSALLDIQNYLTIHPATVKAQVLCVNLLIATGDDYGALSQLKELINTYPEELSFQQTALELQFKIAKFNELLKELAPDWKPQVPSGDLLAKRTIPPAVQSLATSHKLLLARTLWAVRRWDDALLLYESLLQSPVDHEFTEQLKSAEVSLILPPAKKTFWNRITFTTPVQPERLTVVMSPEFTGENLKEPSVSIATDLYVSYRWQQIVTRELSVRQSMYDGNYYQAMKEYQKLLKRDPSMESLFDLAGIYSRLGFSGKEASVYEIISEESPGYPDLDEAIQRNSLKRRPRASLLYADAKKTGREGYYDNEQKDGGLQSWFMPSLNHVVLLDLRRIFSESDVGDQELWRNRLEAEVKWSPLYDLDFLLGIGGDRGDDDYGRTFLYNLQVDGRIGDMVQGYFGLSQDVVDDTVEALMAGINKKEYEAGLSLDFLPRLFGGGEYRFTEYSDGNHQNRYELWTSYILHSEPSLLQLRYGYEYSHNAEGNTGRDYSTSIGFMEEDHPYWSPKEYWQHLFTVSFEHQLAEDVLGRSAPSYYSLEYSFGYEVGGYDNHQMKAKIFLEMSRHFLLNSTFDYIHGSEYEEQDFLISLIYRW